MIEIDESVLREYVAGWDESKMDLLSKAENDLCDVAGLIKAVQCMINSGPEIGLLGLAHKSLRDAKTRIQVCHNELDCEREGIQKMNTD